MTVAESEGGCYKTAVDHEVMIQGRVGLNNYACHDTRLKVGDLSSGVILGRLSQERE
jgi:hypothetical protein